MIDLKKTGCEYYIFILFWLIVLLPKSIQLIGVMVLLLYITKGHLTFPKDNFFRLWLLVFVIYALSIVFNLIASNHETLRVLAAVNTLVISFVALQYYALFSKIEIDTKKIGKYAIWNMALMLFFLGVYLAVSSWKNIIIGGYSLSAIDYIDGVTTTRFVGFLAYANLVPVFSIIMLPFALECLNKKNKLYSFFVLFINLLFSYYANSRTGQLIIIFIIALYMFDFLKLKIQKKSRTLFVTLTGLLICAVGLTLWSIIYTKFQSVFLSREGSNSMRFTLYKESIAKMLFNNPLLGMGIKDLYADTIYPYGSHSSYIGYFYKTGLIGGSIYLGGVCELIKKMLKWYKKTLSDYTYMVCAVGLFMWMLLEDLDGANWVICYALVLLGVINKKCNRFHLNDESNLC